MTTNRFLNHPRVEELRDTLPVNSEIELRRLWLSYSKLAAKTTVDVVCQAMIEAEIKRRGIALPAIHDRRS